VLTQPGLCRFKFLNFTQEIFAETFMNISIHSLLLLTCARFIRFIISYFPEIAFTDPKTLQVYTPG
jgi:hypothetical protein